MVLSGLAFALAGGCPGRQLFLPGEGDGDAALFVSGMIVGAGFAHNFALAGTPDMLESGTPNAVGLAGLIAGIRWVREQGVPYIRMHERALTAQLLAGLASIPGITAYGPRVADRQAATVSFNIENLEPSEVGHRLDEEYAIMCRVGLHCSPAAHRTLGTFPAGTVRFGLGAFNTRDEVTAALQAVAALSGKDL